MLLKPGIGFTLNVAWFALELLTVTGTLANALPHAVVGTMADTVTVVLPVLVKTEAGTVNKPELVVPAV